MGDVRSKGTGVTTTCAHVDEPRDLAGRPSLRPDDEHAAADEIEKAG
jgi:hypothetical protein